MVGILAEEDFEQYVPGAAVATTNGFFDTVDAAATVQTSSVASLARGFRYMNYKRTTTGTGYVGRPLPGTTALRRVRFYMTVITSPSGSTSLIYYTNVSSNRAQIFYSSGTLQCRDVTTAVGSPSASLTVGRRYLCEYMFNPSASQQQFEVWNPDGSSFYDSGLVSAPSTSADRIRFGNPTSRTLEINYDMIADSDQSALIGPANPMDLGMPIAA